MNTSGHIKSCNELFGLLYEVIEVDECCSSHPSVYCEKEENDKTYNHVHLVFKSANRFEYFANMIGTEDEDMDNPLFFHDEITKEDGLITCKYQLHGPFDYTIQNPTDINKKTLRTAIDRDLFPNFRTHVDVYIDKSIINLLINKIKKYKNNRSDSD